MSRAGAHVTTRARYCASRHPHLLHSAWHEFALPLVLAALLLQACGSGSPPAAPGTVTPRFLTAEARDYWPCFSPDGASVVFSRQRGTIWELWVVAAAGGEPRPLLRNALPVSATRPSWSASSQLIAFTGVAPEGTATVWIVNADGTGVHEIRATGLSRKVFYPSWYPRADRLAVMDAQELAIKRIDLPTGTATSLTRREQILTGMPSVSPDGTWIAFAGQANAGQQYDQSQNTIWLLSESTGELHRLEPLQRQGRAPTWAPDGRRLAFESNRDDWRGRYAVYVIDRDGTHPWRVTDPAWNATHPVWSPDGTRLAFAAGSGRAMRIAVVDLPAPR
jgi:Tol biopolymer transport system component